MVIRNFVLFFILLLVGCSAPPTLPSPKINSTPFNTPSASTATLPRSTQTPEPSATVKPLVPHFSHIAVIVFENKEFSTVVGSRRMPNFNRLAEEYTLLTEHYAIRHPSLPNYLALIGGDTFGIDHTCVDCFINKINLPDLIEEAGYTWKTYQEHMPAPCYKQDTLRYYQKHNPFIYFDDIRLDQARCDRSVVPLDELDKDLASGNLPNFIFITPDICNDAHDCGIEVADAWLQPMVDKLLASPAFHQDGLIILTWDEGQGNHSCCGLSTGGGRVATVLISPLVKNGFQDDTPYTHYSLLRTISEAWGLPLLGHATDPQTNLITAPWK
jgi:phosphatidylinositol-3-phosphatase